MKITFEQETEPDELPDLTLKQEKFCKLYTMPGETFGNGTISYLLAYGYDLDTYSDKREIDENGKEIPLTSDRERCYQVSASCASRLLRNEKIIKRNRQLLVAQLTDELADSKLTEHIIKARSDVSLNAVKHYNDLKGRIVKKMDITSKGNALGALSDAELEAMSKEPEEEAL